MNECHNVYSRISKRGPKINIDIPKKENEVMQYSYR